MTVSRPVVIAGNNIDIKKIQERYAPPSIWPKVLLQSLGGAASGSFFTTLLAYVTQLMPFHLSIAGVGLLLGAGAATALLVGIIAIIAVPALVLGAIFAYKSYKALKQQESALREKVNDYINTLSCEANHLTAILQQAKLDFDELLSDKTKKSDDLMEFLPYVKQLQDMLNITVIDFSSPKYQPLLSRYKAHVECKVQQLVTKHNVLAVNNAAPSHAETYDNTKRILNYYDNLTKLGFVASDESAYRHTLRYQEALTQNKLALKKAKQTLPGYSGMQPHQPVGADKDSFFNAISERYKAQGAWAATKLVAHKMGNRTHTMMGGVGLVMGSCMLTLFVLNPVGITLLATTIAIGVIGLAVAGLSLYLQYGVAKEQKQKGAELDSNLGVIAKVKEFDARGSAQHQVISHAPSQIAAQNTMPYAPLLRRTVSSPELSVKRSQATFFEQPSATKQPAATPRVGDHESAQSSAPHFKAS